MPILEVRGLTKYFAGLAAVKDLSFDIEEGQIVGLIGPNGAGKTTVFNLLSGFHTPTVGRVYFGGRPITGVLPHAIARRGLVRTFQIPRPFAGASVWDNVMVGAFVGMANPRAAAERAASALERVSLRSRAGELAANLTLVDKKRLEIARALATRARLLLLDEVLAGLRESELDQAIDLVQSLNRSEGITFLVVEHLMRVIMSISHGIIVLHHGEKIAEGTPSEIARHPDVVAAYLGGGGESTGR